MDILGDIRRIVSDENVLTGDARGDRSAVWGTGQPCRAKALVRPRSTDEVSRIMRLAFAAGQTIVPYGGVTNLVHGCTTTPADIALSFEKMNRIEDIDGVQQTMIAESGVTLLEAQQSAERANLFFPVDIGARATCMVGGNVSSNAGGTRVIRHGMMRDSVLGLEAVLADGTVISSMNRFLKNNSGFDLKQLFIGTEGVLGLVTRIVFRLDVQSKTHHVALVACRDYDNVQSVLMAAREQMGAMLCGFEVMWDNFYDEVVVPRGRLAAPISADYPFYVLIEAMGSSVGTDSDAFEAALTCMFDAALLEDGVIAKSDAEREAIWAIRHEVEWVVRDALVFDVSLPVRQVNDYINIIRGKISAAVSDAHVAVFGHLGDNNIHVSVLTDDRSDATASCVKNHVYESLRPFGGAISAEHGVGLEKRPYLGVSRSAAEIELMRTLKRALDPRNILNPGKVIALA